MKQTIDIREQVNESLIKFLRWAKDAKFESYDWWDIWGTTFGKWAKATYLKNTFLGLPPILLLTFLDLAYPDFRKFFVKRRSFPICHAHIGLGYINLYVLTKDKAYLRKAEDLVAPLLDMASPEANGLGWGMKHEWMTVQGLIPSDTPCNTQTAYPYEFFTRLYEITLNEKHFDYIKSIAAHVANDFPEWQQDDRLVCSYSTIDSRRVVNANSYRMFMLVDAGKRLDNKEYLNKGLATMRYVLAMQSEDGSWPYSEDQPFVDNYHTSFVLKNLYKTKIILESNYSEIDEAIDKGLNYYFANLFDRKGYPIPFSVKPRLVLHKYDSYDLAESIGLLADLNIKTDIAAKLVNFAASEFQTKKGWFIFRKYPFISPIGIPYMRYANSAMFLALTKVLRSINNDSKD